MIINMRTHREIRIEKQAIHQRSKLRSDPYRRNFAIHLRNQTLALQNGSIERNIHMAISDIEVIHITKMRFISKERKIICAKKLKEIPFAFEILTMRAVIPVRKWIHTKKRHKERLQEVRKRPDYTSHNLREITVKWTIRNSCNISRCHNSIDYVAQSWLRVRNMIHNKFWPSLEQAV